MELRSLETDHALALQSIDKLQREVLLLEQKQKSSLSELSQMTGEAAGIGERITSERSVSELDTELVALEEQQQAMKFSYAFVP